MTVSFIGGGNRSTWTKPPTCHKSLTNPNPSSRVKINISDENFDIKKLIQASLYLYIIVTITNSFQTCYKFENYPNLYLYILIHLRHLQFCNLVYCLGKKKYTQIQYSLPPFLMFCRICTFLILKKKKFMQ
jgi:hypothetical protein